jgi:predicted kinase
MEAVIFTGLQASGKSSFYRDRFFATHVRINLDMLGTRGRERILLRACLDARQPFVVDNTNPTREERAVYIRAARDAGFRVIGFFFQATAGECIRRNAWRGGKVPPAAFGGAAKRLVPPAFDEGFDALFTVTLIEPDAFLVEERARPGGA